MIQPVNVVGGGDLDCELDLDRLSSALDADYNPESFPGIVLRIEPATCLIFRSGKYVITGASNPEKFEVARRQLSNILYNESVISDKKIRSTIYNIVYKGDLNTTMDLEHLIPILGLENIEYEPEQYPFLVYRPVELECVVTISSSGKIVINGVTSESTASEAFDLLRQKLPNK